MDPLFEGTSSLFLLVTGAGLALAIVLQRDAAVKLVQLTVFLLLAAVQRRRLHPVGMSILFAATVFLNLLLREGRILLVVFSFPVTEEALLRGVRRSLSLGALFYMSKAILSGALTGGRGTGAWLTDVFRYFHYFSTRLRSVRFRTLFSDLDRLLLDAERLAETPPAVPVRRRRLGGYALLLTVLAGNLISLIFSFDGTVR